MSSRTAAIILIGNELLTGKVVDANAAYAIPRLWDLGVVLVPVLEHLGVGQDAVVHTEDIADRAVVR